MEGVPVCSDVGDVQPHITPHAVVDGGADEPLLLLRLGGVLRALGPVDVRHDADAVVGNLEVHPLVVGDPARAAPRVQPGDGCDHAARHLHGLAVLGGVLDERLTLRGIFCGSRVFSRRLFRRFILSCGLLGGLLYLGFLEGEGGDGSARVVEPHHEGAAVVRDRLV